MWSILRGYCMQDERVFRVVAYIVMCALVQAYPDPAPEADLGGEIGGEIGGDDRAASRYCLITSTLVWRSFETGTRAQVIDFICGTKKRPNDMLVIYATRQFIIYAADKLPGLKRLVEQHYQWNVFRRTTHRNMTRVCNMLISSSHRSSRTSVNDINHTLAD